MPTTVTILFFVVLICFAAWYRLHKAVDIAFLRLITRYPDKAYDWFIAEQCWLVVDLKSPSVKKPELSGLKEYKSPFTLNVPKLNGRVVTVYGRSTGIEDSEKRFIERYGRG